MRAEIPQANDAEIALLGAIGAYGLRVARSTGAIPPELAARAQAQMHADYASEAATWENFGAAEAPTPPPAAPVYKDNSPIYGALKLMERA